MEAESTSTAGAVVGKPVSSSTSSAQLLRIGDVFINSGAAVERGVNSGAPGFNLEPCQSEVSASQKIMNDFSTDLPLSCARSESSQPVL